MWWVLWSFEKQQCVLVIHIYKVGTEAPFRYQQSNWLHIIFNQVSGSCVWLQIKHDIMILVAYFPNFFWFRHFFPFVYVAWFFVSTLRPSAVVTRLKQTLLHKQFHISLLIYSIVFNPCLFTQNINPYLPLPMLKTQVWAFGIPGKIM
jgi:hypothetical protein